MGKLTPIRHPYLFGGGISAVLIAGAVFAFVSMVAVISETNLPGSASPVSTPPHGNLTIGAGEGIVGGHADGSSVTPLGTALAFAHPPGTVSAPPTAANRRTVGSRGAPAGSSRATGRTNGGADAGPQRGGPTPVNPGQGGQPPAPGEGPSSPGPGQAAPTAVPPGLAKKPGGLPPGLAKKPGGLPPGLAKKPGGLPPGHARR
jgi:hypothetical protein